MDKKAITILLILCIFTFIFKYLDFSKGEEKKTLAQEKSGLTNIINSKYYYQKKNSTQEIEDKSKKIGLIELNTADMKDIIAMNPRIDSIEILKVLGFRKILRGFKSADQLYLISDLSEKTANQLKKITFVEPIHDSIFVNEESFESLLQHPFLSWKQCDIIYKLRERKGKVSSIKRLRMLEEFKEKDLENLEPYLNFRIVNQ